MKKEKQIYHETHGTDNIMENKLKI